MGFVKSIVGTLTGSGQAKKAAAANAKALAEQTAAAQESAKDAAAQAAQSQAAAQARAAAADAASRAAEDDAAANAENADVVVGTAESVSKRRARFNVGTGQTTNTVSI